MASVISMKALLEAGVHFGHQTRRWNPKMKPFIFQERNGIYIIDLSKTVLMLREVYAAVKQMARDGKVILFVGTKKQAQDVVREEAERAGTFFVNERWLGGTLTNFSTIQKRIARLRELEGMRAQGNFDLLPKKEVSRLIGRARETRALPRRHQGHAPLAGCRLYRRPEKRAHRSSRSTKSSRFRSSR